MRNRRGTGWSASTNHFPSNERGLIKPAIKNLWLPAKRKNPVLLYLSYWMPAVLLFATVKYFLSKDESPTGNSRGSYREQIDYVRDFLIEHHYKPIRRDTDAYDIFNCPNVPPLGYPREYPILDVLGNWKVQTVVDPPEMIYQGLCVFDLAMSEDDDSDGTFSLRQQIQKYRAEEVPFIVRNDPAVLESAILWSNADYLSSKLAGKMFQATLSNTTIVTYYSTNSEYNDIPTDFVPPTRESSMSFEEWYTRAKREHKGNDEHAYLRLDACLPDRDCDSTYRAQPTLDDANFIYEDLKFFQGSTAANEDDLYGIDPTKARGIQCRFGTPGLTAENHFDNERNFVAVLGGSRRFLLAHPRNCPTMHLHPQKHPLERHTRVDWSDPNLTQFPDFFRTTVNEAVLQAGDVLYLPTFWFHHIVSLTLNYQCNTRSGYSVEHDQTIFDCGFFYDFP